MKRRRRKSNKIEVIERRLGREGCDGLAWLGENKIEIHTDLPIKERLFVICHEVAHLAFPEAKESEILRFEKMIGQTLWDQGYRKVDL